MKTSNLVIILLITLILCGWMSVLLADESDIDKEYREHVQLAEDYRERGLFQKAIMEYEAAISLNGDEEDWKELLEVYEARYEEENSIYSEYLDKLISAIERYENNEKFYCILGELCIKNEDYLTAYKYLSKAIENGVSDKKIESMYLETKYKYEVVWNTYSDYRSCSNGYYAVCEGEKWTYIEEDGTSTKIGKLKFAGRVGEKGIRLICNDNKVKLLDENDVIQGLLKFEPEDCGLFSEELISIKKDGKFAYYNSLGDKQFGDYDIAGTFVNGLAAVKKANSWDIINIEGEVELKTKFEDIKLNLDNTYIKSNVIIAQKDGKYQFYNKELEIVNETKYEDCDVITEDGLIAMKQNGKWGFVDLNGKEVIAPKYERACSFSNGLAAVYNGEKWGFINKDNELVIDYLFFDVDYFNSKGCCMVKTTNQTWQLISLYIVE